MLNLFTQVATHRNVTGKNPSIASPEWKIMRIFVIWCKRQFFWLVGRPVCPSLFWLLVSFLWWNNSRLSVWGQPRYSQRPVCPRTAVLHCHTLSHTLSCTLSLNIVFLLFLLRAEIGKKKSPFGVVWVAGWVTAEVYDNHTHPPSSHI